MAYICLTNLGSTFAFNYHRLPYSPRPPLHLHDLHRLRAPQASARRAEWPPARWLLRRFGILINDFAFLNSGFVIIFSYFPASVLVTLTTANWAPAVWVGVMLLSVVIYVVYGKRHYTPPAVFVEGKREGAVELQGVD